MKRLLPFLVFLFACDNPVDTSENKLPYLSEMDTKDDGDLSDAEDAYDLEGCDCLAPGQWFRFDSLVLQSMGGEEHVTQETLNSFWQDDIRRKYLNILMLVTEVADDHILVEAMNGARIQDEDDICILEHSRVPVRFPRRGCRLDLSDATPFNVYAGSTTRTKNCNHNSAVPHVIPVFDAQLEGVIDAECTGISQGFVARGSLGQRELEDVCTCMSLTGLESCGALEPGYISDEGTCADCSEKFVSLANLLNMFEEPNWDCETSAGTPATCITASFSAQSLEASPSSCPE